MAARVERTRTEAVASWPDERLEVLFRKAQTPHGGPKRSLGDAEARSALDDTPLMRGERLGEKTSLEGGREEFERVASGVACESVVEVREAHRGGACVRDAFGRRPHDLFEFAQIPDPRVGQKGDQSRRRWHRGSPGGTHRSRVMLEEVRDVFEAAAERRDLEERRARPPEERRARFSSVWGWLAWAIEHGHDTCGRR